MYLLRKSIYHICVLCISVLLASCGTGRGVIVRGDQGREVVIPSKGTVKESGPAVKTDNEVLAALLGEAYQWLGTPYQWGGKTKSGADCSGFVMMSFKNALGINLPRTSYDQSEYCHNINKKDLLPGDLVFFRTTSADRVSHVGLYIGDNKIIHSSRSRGVMVSSLSERYYTEHYHHSGRVDAYHKLVASNTKKKKEEAKAAEKTKEEKPKEAKVKEEKPKEAKDNKKKEAKPKTDKKKTDKKSSDKKTKLLPMPMPKGKGKGNMIEIDPNEGTKEVDTAIGAPEAAPAEKKEPVGKEPVKNESEKQVAAPLPSSPIMQDSIIKAAPKIDTTIDEPAPAPATKPEPTATQAKQDTPQVEIEKVVIRRKK